MLLHTPPHPLYSMGVELLNSARDSGRYSLKYVLYDNASYLGMRSSLTICSSPSNSSRTSRPLNFNSLVEPARTTVHTRSFLPTPSTPCATSWARLAWPRWPGQAYSSAAQQKYVRLGHHDFHEPWQPMRAGSAWTVFALYVIRNV